MASSNNRSRSTKPRKSGRARSGGAGSSSNPRARGGGSTRAKRSSSGSRPKARSSTNGHSSSRELPNYSIMDPEEIEEAVDVYVDAPAVKVDEIKFELDDLRAHVALLAEAGHFVQINAGVAARLGKVELDIQGVEAQALMEVRLHNVTKCVDRVLTTLDRNPELLKSVGDALGEVGGGARDLLGDTGDTVKSAGKGAQGAVKELGQGAGQGVAGLGEGAQQGLRGVGQGAQQGLQGV